MTKQTIDNWLLARFPRSIVLVFSAFLHAALAALCIAIGLILISGAILGTLSMVTWMVALAGGLNMLGGAAPFFMSTTPSFSGVILVVALATWMIGGIYKELDNDLPKREKKL